MLKNSENFSSFARTRKEKNTDISVTNGCKVFSKKREMIAFKGSWYCIILMGIQKNKLINLWLKVSYSKIVIDIKFQIQNMFIKFSYKFFMTESIVSSCECM